MEAIRELLQRQFITFLMVGVLNTLFGYSLFALLIYVGLHYTIATFIGTVLGVLFNFKTTGKLVFDSHDNRLLWKFFGVYGVMYFFNIIGLYFLDILIKNIYISGAVLILPMALVGFVLNRRFVFN
jgi:putative flippase GtrA